MTMANPQLQAMKLAEKIKDEFLTCKICFEHYKDPKCLSCLHTFCEECIEQHVSAQRSYKYTDYREFSCPICRKKTVIPAGGVRKLNDNFLISSLNELLLSKRPSKVATCDICKIVNQKEKEATSKCVECQKLMCRSCVVTHQQMKITINHSIYELEIEKDIMCKQHPNEQVRFYCEACEVCVCVPCTYTDHRDHDLVDFKEGIAHHKDAIEDNLRKCRQKISEIRNRLDLLKKCESHILFTQNEIHSIALTFIDAIRQKEHNLLNELHEFYGDEANDYIKKRDDLETFLDQLKSTCNLTEMVVKGKDIEMLLLKKQLCEKFDEFQDIELDPVPENIFKKVFFIPGSVDLGKITEINKNAHKDNTKSPGNTSKISSSKCLSIESNEDTNEDITNNCNSSNNNINEDDEEFDDVDESNHEQDEKSLQEKESNHEESCTTGVEKCDKTTQIFYRDMREIVGDKIKETEVQTDIRMIHDLVPPNKYQLFKQESLSKLASKTDSKSVQTDPQAHPSLSNQSSLDEDSNSNAPVDRTKLGRRVRRHVKPGCSIAVLPNSEIIIIDPESNCMTILDRRGKFKYGMSNSNKPCTENGHQTSSTQFGNVTFGHLPKLERGVRIMTPQGTLIVKLENETLNETPNVALAVHAYDRMAADNNPNGSANSNN